MTKADLTGVRPQFHSPRSALAPATVAIVGASERARWPAQLITNMKQLGFPGRVFLVNPNQKQLFGERCYPSLRDLPEAVEHALIVVPAPAVPAALEDAEAFGVRTATIYSAGLGDGEEPESKERGNWLRQFLSGSRLRVSGPNCMGALSYRERLFAYPVGTLGSLTPGPTAAVFQSGGTLIFYVQSAADRGVRFSYAISSGNEVDLDLADYVNFLVEDPATRVIALFIEGIRRPEAFMTAAGRALAAGKPILAIKTGQSEGSASAAQSHTGAIAGNHAAFLTMCDRYGIVSCRNLDDLVQQSLAFQMCRRPKGPKLAFITNSGGAVDLLYDHCDTEQAVLAQLAPETNAALLPLMQEGIKPKNPLDVGLPAGNETAAKWCRAMLDDSGVDMLAFAAQPRTPKDFGDIAPYKRVLDATDKPVLGFSRFAYSAAPEAAELQETLGVPIIQGLDATVRAMNALWFHAERQGKVPPTLPQAPASRLDRANLEETLAAYGISGPRSRLVATVEEAARAAQDIGYPVALKIQSLDILHKTEAGGVALGLASREAVEDAANALLYSAAAAFPGARLDGFLVQEMVSGVEAIVGARADDLYGPILVAGTGGILVELAKDVALSLLPASQGDITRMVDRLKLARLLAGYRGRPAADRAALEATIAGLAHFYLDHRAQVRDIEINPLIVRSGGQGAVAVDVRVIWNDGE